MQILSSVLIKSLILLIIANNKNRLPAEADIPA